MRPADRQPLEVEVPAYPEATWRLRGAGVEQWRAQWIRQDDESEESASELVLPTRAGIREGYTRLEPHVSPTDGGARLALSIEAEVLRVNTGAAFVLLLGAIGGLLVVVWPLHDALLKLAPIGAVLALVAWLLVASRFRSHGPHELLELVRDLAEESGDEGSSRKECSVPDRC